MNWVKGLAILMAAGVLVTEVAAQPLELVPRPVDGAVFLAGNLAPGPLAPVNNSSYGCCNGGCSLDKFGEIDGCFCLVAADPASGVINEAVMDSMADTIGVSLVDNVTEFTATDTLACLGEDPNHPGMNLFTLTLSVETGDSAVEINPTGFTNPDTMAPITELAIFVGDAVVGASPVTFVDPIEVIADDLDMDGIADTNVEVFDTTGTSVGGPIALDLDTFFNGGDWDGGLGITFEGGIDGKLLVGQTVVRITYRTSSTCPDDDCLLGDVNRDGIVSLLDVDPFVALLSSGKFQCEGDFNLDGLVNLLDVDGFTNELIGI